MKVINLLEYKKAKHKDKIIEQYIMYYGIQISARKYKEEAR